VLSRSFAEMLERIINSYQNRAIEVAEVISGLIELAIIECILSKSDDAGILHFGYRFA
jgi:hypothetical protein